MRSASADASAKPSDIGDHASASEVKFPDQGGSGGRTTGPHSAW
jgi:hypothetical protein